MTKWGVGTKRGAVVAVASVLVLVATACGSSGGSKGASTKETTTKADPPADRTRAQSLLLVAADLPAGWAGTTHVKDPDEAVENKKLADCIGATDPSAYPASLDGDDFEKGTSEISSTASVVATRAEFLDDVKAIKSDKALSCVQTIFSEDLPKSLAKSNPGVTISDLKVTRLSPSKTYGDVTVGFRISLTVAGAQGSIGLYIDQYQLGSGRDEVSVTFDSQDSPFDAALEQTVLATAGGKLGKSSA